MTHYGIRSKTSGHWGGFGTAYEIFHTVSRAVADAQLASLPSDWRDNWEVAVFADDPDAAPIPAEHEQITLGKFVLYRHSYDGDTIQVVWGQWQQAIHASKLEEAVHALFIA